MTEDARTYYDVLEVRPDADHRQIRDAYRRLARRLHPDSTSGEGSPEAMRELNAAWMTLGDETKRARYDQRLAAERQRKPKPTWRPLDHSIDEEDDPYPEDFDDTPGPPLDATTARNLRLLTFGALAAAAASFVFVFLAVLLQTAQFVSAAFVALAFSGAAFTMATLYAMSRTRRKPDG